MACLIPDCIVGFPDSNDPHLGGDSWVAVPHLHLHRPAEPLLYRIEEHSSMCHTENLMPFGFMMICTWHHLNKRHRHKPPDSWLPRSSLQMQLNIAVDTAASQSKAVAHCTPHFLVWEHEPVCSRKPDPSSASTWAFEASKLTWPSSCQPPEDLSTNLNMRKGSLGLGVPHVMWPCSLVAHKGSGDCSDGAGSLPAAKLKVLM